MIGFSLAVTAERRQRATLMRSDPSALGGQAPASGLSATQLMWAAFALVVALGAIAPLRRTGDAAEFYAMAFALAEGRTPALTAPEIADFKAWMDEQPVSSRFPAAVRAVDQPPLVSAGRQDFPHFWFYSLGAAPLIGIARALDLHERFAFLALNATVLAVALREVGRSFGPEVSLLVLASPLIWFVDKAQTEVFVASLLCVAMASARRGQNRGAALASAFASTQGLPILGAVACFWTIGTWTALRTSGGSRRSLPMGRPGQTLTGVAVVAATAVVALLHPAYYWWRLGVPSPLQLTHGYSIGLPPSHHTLALFLDPDIGFLAWYPVIVAVALAGAVILARTSRWKPSSEAYGLRTVALAGLVCAALFTFAFAQNTGNVNNGGTVHVSRYTLWLVPLTLPLLAAAGTWSDARGRKALLFASLVAFTCYAAYFRPSRHEHYVDPSPQSDLLAAWAPTLYRQLPEIFYERQQGIDGEIPGSTANSVCTVVLLSDGASPSPCPLSPVESGAAAELMAAGWRSVWVVRPGRLGLGGGGVSGAIPGGAAVDKASDRSDSAVLDRHAVRARLGGGAAWRPA